MRVYEDYFSDDEIIDALIRMRLEIAKTRHERLYFSRQSRQIRPPKEKCPLTGLFPPRRSWQKFRPRDRKNRTTNDVNSSALKRATKTLRLKAPNSNWAQELELLVTAIRRKALNPSGHKFSTISVTHQHKKGNEYRPIAKFQNIEDRIIDGISAKYLREVLDETFEESSVAFRVQSQAQRIGRHTAIEKIEKFRKTIPSPIHVAECDIRGFFDCVHHGTAISALKASIKLAKRKKAGTTVDQRALSTFKNYLNAYSFPQSVLRIGSRALVKETCNPNAFFKWPEQDLITDGHFKRPKSAKIGVPQGGAISCLIANLILDRCDKAISAIPTNEKSELLYLRYCDDIIILSRSKRDCEKAFNAYLQQLKKLKFCFHPPQLVGAYGRQYYQDKSKSPYYWGDKRALNWSPWIQFLGYQIRCDGLFRIRASSFSKHTNKIIRLTDNLLQIADSSLSKINKNRVIYRHRQKLLSRSVGRVTHWNFGNGPLPMCWASGFNFLHKRPFPPLTLSRLDNLVGRECSRIERQLRRFDLTDVRHTSLPIEDQGFIGYPYSHQAQFTNDCGAQLIKNYRQPNFCEENCIIPLMKSHKNLRR